nr:UDP-glucose:glycoprotein glucosyltransferase 1 [Haemonchus contortus]
MVRLLLYVGLLLYCISGAVGSLTKSLIVSLNSKWNSTSLIAEISEFMSKEDEQLFWRFISGIADECSAMNWNQVSDKMKYDFGLQQASKMLSAPLIDLLKLSLSLRIYSPSVQLFQQIGADHALSCVAFFDVHGLKGCDASELENAVESAHGRDPPALFSIDHVFNLGREAEITAIIYGEIGTMEWLQLHAKAVELASARRIQYVLRHYMKCTDTPIAKVSLSGYGVELAIKNTEYKVVDITRGGMGENHDIEDFHGFNFKQLKEKNVESNGHFDAFKMHLMEMQELGSLKQWQLQDLSFQVGVHLVEGKAQPL